MDRRTGNKLIGAFKWGRNQRNRKEYTANIKEVSIIVSNSAERNKIN
jgi:hypothetical protein